MVYVLVVHVVRWLFLNVSKSCIILQYKYDRILLNIIIRLARQYITESGYKDMKNYVMFPKNIWTDKEGQTV